MTYSSVEAVAMLGYLSLLSTRPEAKQHNASRKGKGGFIKLSSTLPPPSPTQFLLFARTLTWYNP